MMDAKVVQNAIVRECNAVMNILVEKNIKYGNSAIDPIRIFSSCDPDEQLNVRIDDKLSRVKRGQGKDDEDVSLDLIGYLILKRVHKLLKDSGYEFEADVDSDEFFSGDDNQEEGKEDELDQENARGWGNTDLSTEAIRESIKALREPKYFGAREGPGKHYGDGWGDDSESSDSDALRFGHRGRARDD